MPKAAWLLLLVGVGSAQVGAPGVRNLPLGEAVSASLPLQSGGSRRIKLSLKKGESRLLVEVSGGRQALTVGSVADGFEPAGAVLAGDFNFDGFTDLALPAATGYGGVNYFYDLYAYNPASRRFALLAFPGEGGPQLCNPEPNRAARTLQTDCKSGPKYVFADYRFVNGRPYLFRALQMAPLLLNGAGGDEIVYPTKLYDPGGRLIRSAVYDQPRGGRPSVRSIADDRLVLYTAPDESAATPAYVVRGDRVELLDILEGDYSWIQVAYQSRRLGRIVRWIRAR